MVTHRCHHPSTRQSLATILVVVTLVCLMPDKVYADPLAQEHHLFLPLVLTGPSVQASETVCQLNEQEQRLDELFRTHAEQQRTSLTCNAKLTAVARARAEDMGRRAYFNHVNPDGHGPNYLVRQAGYVLADGYGQELTSNNIESIGAGPNGADSMWNAWMGSEKHSTHLLGKTGFFAEQIEYGIGFVQVPGSPYQYYWVFISARPGS
ncbi:MAG: hypothetical protein KF832_29685 [Caldilineaceae bacterium]|nr:hypothetical protein [Caldilineaceae bacterium]